MLTIHEKTNNEMGLRRKNFILFSLIRIKFQELLPAEVEHQERGNKADDAAHAHIRQEMLREVNARIGTQYRQDKQHQHRQIDQDPRPAAGLLLMIVVSQEQRKAGTEDEECRGVARREGIAVMHLHPLHQRQHHILGMLERTHRTVAGKRVFQDLQHPASRQFAQGEEDRQLDLLPEQREQRQDIDRTFGHHGIILKESILNPRVMGIQQQMKLKFRIYILQSEYNHQQYQICYAINSQRPFHLFLYRFRVQRYKILRNYHHYCHKNIQSPISIIVKSGCKIYEKAGNYEYLWR